jgi:hypothetical protein
MSVSLTGGVESAGFNKLLKPYYSHYPYPTPRLQKMAYLDVV